MSSLEELKKSRMKNNSLEEKLSKCQEEAETLKQEVDKFNGEIKNLKYQRSISERFKESNEALNKVLSLQRFPRDKTGLGYDQEHAIKGLDSIT